MERFSARQMKFFDHARRVAEMSDFSRARVGCVVVEGKKILSVGFSSHRTHPLQAHYNQLRNFNKTGRVIHSLHSEIMALAPIIGASDINWSKVEIYIYRIRKDKPFGMARPCPSCFGCISDCHIKNIYYTTDYGYAHERVA